MTYDEGAKDPSSHIQFPSTDWDVVRAAQRLPAKQRIRRMATVMLPYRRPLYAYFRAQGCARQDAEDMVQGFFEAVICRRDLLATFTHTSRFRHWVMACALNYLRDRRRAERAQKRSPAAGMISLEDLKRADGAGYEPVATGASPEEAFRESWRRELLERALAQVAVECRRHRRELDYAIFLDYYASDAHDEPTWREIAQRHELDNWKIATRKADWVKRQLARAIRHEIAQYTKNEDELEQELAELLE